MPVHVAGIQEAEDWIHYSYVMKSKTRREAKNAMQILQKKCLDGAGFVT